MFLSPNPFSPEGRAQGQEQTTHSGAGGGRAEGSAPRHTRGFLRSEGARGRTRKQCASVSCSTRVNVPEGGSHVQLD